jgi:hypothetical protein
LYLRDDDLGASLAVRVAAHIAHGAGEERVAALAAKAALMELLAHGLHSHAYGKE